MYDKKTFFASLSPKVALGLGVVTGFMVICTIGFIVLGVMMLTATGGDKTAKVDKTTTVPTINVPTVVKADKPTVELFIMSYCPFGLQMQKAFIPVMELLGKDAELSIKFVDYIMHQKKEGDENTVQYCIQKEQSNRFISYSRCFTITGNGSSCLKTTKVDETKLKTCIDATNKQYNILAQYETTDKYPAYPLHAELNTKYGVQGSPTLVVNGAKVEGVSRSPEALKQVVCAAFNKTPKACEKTLDTKTSGSGFGDTVGTDNAAAGCET